MKRRAHWLVALACALGGAGCTSAGNGRMADLTNQSTAALIVAGTTSRAQVARALGTGRSVRFNSGCEVWLYDSAEGPPMFVNFIPLGGLLASRMNVHARELKILFDERGIVRKFAIVDVSAE